MTDPKTLMQTEVQNNFPLFGNIRTAVDYFSVASSDYSPSAGEVSESINSTQSSVYVIFTGYKIKDVDGSMIHINDQKAIIPTLDLTAVPSDLDYLTVGSVRWDVQNVKTDPANATWTLQVRKKVTA